MCFSEGDSGFRGRVPERGHGARRNFILGNDTRLVGGAMEQPLHDRIAPILLASFGLTWEGGHGRRKLDGLYTIVSEAERNDLSCCLVLLGSLLCTDRPSDNALFLGRVTPSRTRSAGRPRLRADFVLLDSTATETRAKFRTRRWMSPTWRRSGRARC